MASTEDEKEPGRVRLVSPLNWLGLTAVVVLLAAFLIWLFVGTVEHVVDGSGIIIRDSEFGIFAVAGTRGGQVAEVLVKEGDRVEANQIIATLQAEGLRGQIDVAEHLLAKLKESPDESLRQKIADAELRLEALKGQYESEAVIRSEHAGRVTEVVVGAGAVIPPGRTILRLESLDGDHEVLAYVSAVEGKKIKVGMTARVVPSSSGTHVGGHILGKVSYVSLYPVTRDYLTSELGGNQLLAEYLLGNGSSIEVNIELPRAPAFGTDHGPSEGVIVESGLLVNAFIVLEKSRPISLLFPAWK